MAVRILLLHWRRDGQNTYSVQTAHLSPEKSATSTVDLRKPPFVLISMIMQEFQIPCIQTIVCWMQSFKKATFDQE